MTLTIPTQRALVLHGPQDLRVEHRPLWPPAPGQAQVVIATTGLCGSDLHYFLKGRNGDFAIQSPLVLGHEASGVVTAVGHGVTHLRVGQRVAIECGVMCNDCVHCKGGRYNLCKHMRFCSSAKTFPHLDGTLQERLNHPAHLLHPLPDNVSFTQASLAEPLSVLIHAARRVSFGNPSASVYPEQTVLVLGVGAIGLLACAVAKYHGAARVVAADINAARLSFAKDMGFADEAFNVGLARARAIERLSATRSTAHAEDLDEIEVGGLIAQELISTTLSPSSPQYSSPGGFTTTFECTGAAPCIQLSILASAPGAKVVLIGMGSSPVALPVSLAQGREVDLFGSFRYAGTYPEALRMLSSSEEFDNNNGRDGRRLMRNIEMLVTHRVPLFQSCPSTSSDMTSFISPRHKLPSPPLTPISRSPSPPSSAESSSSADISETSDSDFESDNESVDSQVEDAAAATEAFNMLSRGYDEDGRMVIKVILEGDLSSLDVPILRLGRS